MVRRLPLLADVFADRTIKISKLSDKWLKSRGIVREAGETKEQAAERGGFFVQDVAQLSVPSTMVTPDAAGETARDRIYEILRSRKLVIGFDFKSKIGEPLCIHLDPPLTAADEAYIAQKPAPEDPEKIWFGRVKLLTETSKMGCYSWNLPPGPPKLGGTCPSASLGFLWSAAEDAQRQGGNVLEESGSRGGTTAYRLDPAEHPINFGTFLCNGCYAFKGNYEYANINAMMATRYALVRTLLGGSGSKAVKGIYFVDGDAYQRAREEGAKPREAVLAAYRAGEARELTTGGEAGVKSLAWLLKTAIVCADAHSRATREGRAAFSYRKSDYAAVRRFYENAMREAEQDAKAAGKERKQPPSALAREKTEKAYAWSVPEPGFFRLHDSGDFFSMGYWRAWATVMAELPHTRFWAPNRTWAHRSATCEPQEIPENLAMRPSALHFDDPPPSQALLRSVKLPIYQKGKGGGFAAGSGSGDPDIMAPVPGTPFHAFVAAPDEGFWECPAYAYWDKGGGSVFGTSDRPAGGTCILAKGPNGEKGCRVCWGGHKGEYASVGVVYHKHL